MQSCTRKASTAGAGCACAALATCCACYVVVSCNALLYWCKHAAHALPCCYGLRTYAPECMPARTLTPGRSRPLHVLPPLLQVPP
jgi:hypothetical protein